MLLLTQLKAVAIQDQKLAAIQGRNERRNDGEVMVRHTLPSDDSAAKRALKSVLRTVSIPSPDVKPEPAVETTFVAPQPPSAKKIEATKQARGSPARSHPCNLSTAILPRGTPMPLKLNGERPCASVSEATNAPPRRAHSAFIYNYGHSANIVRRTLQSIRQSNDHFAHNQFLGARRNSYNQDVQR